MLSNSATRPFLAIETSTRTARVGLFDAAGNTLALAAQTADRHSAGLLSLCDQLFQQTGTAPCGLVMIACGAGPGSFTGLRVGLALAKGLALPFATPLVLISSLHTLACDLAALPQAKAASHLVACLDAGKGELHAQIFFAGQHGPEPQQAAWRLSPEELCKRLELSHGQGPMVAGGPELAKFPALVARAQSPTRGASWVLDAPGPSAVCLAGLALDALADGQAQDLATAAPTYGRLPDITQPRRKIVGPGQGH